MRSLQLVLILSVLLIAFGSNAQYNTKKYIKKNKKAETIVYGDSTIYSRGLYIDSAKLLIGSSDGSIYMYKHSWNKSRLIFKLDNFKETRDIERSGDQYIGMQSGDDGKLVLLDKSGSIKMLAKEEWKGIFFDGIDFQGSRGFLMGDPVDSSFSLFHTNDHGNTWTRCEGNVKAFKEEAGFAASGTNVFVKNDSTYCFITGGMKSRFIQTTDNGKTWTSVVLPYLPGKSNGAYSMCFANDSIGVIVGGDYADPDIHLNSSYYTTDGGATWYNPMHTPRGYRSCVYQVNDVFYACGRNGIDFSLNGGKDWIPFADGTYFSLGSDGSKLYATKRYGEIQVFDLIEEE